MATDRDPLLQSLDDLIAEAGQLTSSYHQGAATSGLWGHADFRFHPLEDLEEEEGSGSEEEEDRDAVFGGVGKPSGNFPWPGMALGRRRRSLGDERCPLVPNAKFKTRRSWPRTNWSQLSRIRSVEGLTSSMRTNVEEGFRDKSEIRKVDKETNTEGDLESDTDSDMEEEEEGSEGASKSIKDSTSLEASKSISQSTAQLKFEFFSQSPPPTSTSAFTFQSKSVPELNSPLTPEPMAITTSQTTGGTDLGTNIENPNMDGHIKGTCPSEHTEPSSPDNFPHPSLDNPNGTETKAKTKTQEVLKEELSRIRDGEQTEISIPKGTGHEKASTIKDTEMGSSNLKEAENKLPNLKEGCTFKGEGSEMSTLKGTEPVDDSTFKDGDHLATLKRLLVTMERLEEESVHRLQEVCRMTDAAFRMLEVSVIGSLKSFQPLSLYSTATQNHSRLVVPLA